MALDTVGAVRDRDAVALDLPVERIAADLEVCRDQRHIQMILLDYLQQRLALGTLERRTRSSRVCSVSGVSPISSRNSVPPDA
jgi:hypothetical protein